MWMNLLLVAAVILCGLQALHARRLLVAALWLAVTSALLAATLYRVGAPEVAVIELSVGAGLVTILFVFAIATASEDALSFRTVVPAALAWSLIAVMAVLLSRAVWSLAPVESARAEASFATVLWEQRGLDVLVQIGLMFTGVLGILGLLGEPSGRHVDEPAREQTSEPLLSQEVTHPAPRLLPKEERV